MGLAKHIANMDANPTTHVSPLGIWSSEKLFILKWNICSGFAVHHTAGARCTTQAACDTQMRNIQNFHMNTNGWADIGYNFCIGDPGQVYEGRGYGRQVRIYPPPLQK